MRRGRKGRSLPESGSAHQTEGPARRPQGPAEQLRPSPGSAAPRVTVTEQDCPEVTGWTPQYGEPFWTQNASCQGAHHVLPSTYCSEETVLLPEGVLDHFLFLLFLYMSVYAYASAVSDSCDPMDCSPPDSSVHGTLQARILEWVSMPSSRGSSRPRGGTHTSSVSCAYH